MAAAASPPASPSTAFSLAPPHILRADNGARALGRPISSAATGASSLS